MVLEVAKHEAKNKDDALNKCLEELNVNLSEVYYYLNESESGLFKSKKYTAYVTTKYSVKEYIRNYLTELARKMGTTFNVEVNENDGVKINLDIAGYKSKREKNIMYEAKKIAREVSKTKIDAKLDPMNSYERRLVHTAISDFKHIDTESEGEEPNRCVVIKYVE